MYLNSIVKRIFDLAGFFVSVFVFGPISIFIAICIYFDDRKDTFFVQERVGKDSIRINVYKFRTMENGEVTRVGRWLRKTGLDELPQYINVFKGEMSIVGPRPLTDFDIKRLKWGSELNRWTMCPGLTGLAQIRSGVSAERSLQADLEYQKSANIWLDIKIILISFLMNLFGKRKVQSKISQFIF